MFARTIERWVTTTDTDGRVVTFPASAVSYVREINEGGSTVALAGGHVVRVVATRQEIMDRLTEVCA